MKNEERRIRVVYATEHTGFCKTIFRTVEKPFRYYNRVEKSGWCTSSLPFFESDIPISNESITFEIVSSKNHSVVLFEENSLRLGVFVCEREFHKQKAQEVWSDLKEKGIKLSTHNEWVKYHRSREVELKISDTHDTYDWMYRYEETEKTSIGKYSYLDMEFEVQRLSLTNKIAPEIKTVAYKTFLVKHPNHSIVSKVEAHTIGYVL